MLKTYRLAIHLAASELYSKDELAQVSLHCALHITRVLVSLGTTGINRGKLVRSLDYRTSVVSNM